jgi:dCMP deaminase
VLNDKNFMKIAEEIANASNCVSRHVGAVIVKDGRVISTGYNGTPKGYMNCSEHWNNEYTKDHHEWSLLHEIHAEMNAIIWAARTGISIEGSTLYCTTEPCSECSKNLIASGVTRIVWKDKYPYNDINDISINDMLKTCNVIKEQYE